MTEILGQLTIPSSRWVAPPAMVTVLILLILLWAYRRARAFGAVPAAAFALKLLGVLLLVLCIIEPLWSGAGAKSGANLFVVLADNSAGMTIHDRDADKSRAEILTEALTLTPDHWLDTLSEDFQVRRYLLDSRLHSTADFSELAFDGNASSIGAHLATIAERYRGRPLAGVLLLTDGIATDIGDEPLDLGGLPPIYPVVIGRSGPQKDIALSSVVVSQTSFEDAPVTLRADIDCRGFSGKSVVVRLTDEAGKTVEEQTLKFTKDEQTQATRFNLRPEKAGISFYDLQVAEKSQLPAKGFPEETDEATQANNHRLLAVDRGQGPYRILYVSGRPNWEFKFLRRALQEDEQVQLVGLLRIARREPMFTWRGRQGETSNPLFRGFDGQDEEQTENYDQPVLIRLNTRDEVELRDGFPKTEEELYRYHALILDDLSAEFFTADQMALIQTFVSQRGGGFLMLGGQESFRRGKFDRTPIGQILPVYMDRMPDPPTTARLNWDLTLQGYLQPWARLRDTRPDEETRIVEMPAFRVLNPVGAVKPGAAVLATAADRLGRKFPALAVHRFGKGRVAAITVGDMWRWGLKQKSMHDDMDKFWRQTLRWLVADVPQRIELAAKHQRRQANQPVELGVLVRDKNFEVMDDASVILEVRDPQGQLVRLPAEPSATEAGRYEATYLPRQNGAYLARTLVTDSQGLRIGEAQAGWVVDLQAQEFQSLRANRPLLERIAQETGGQIIELQDLKDFAGSLPSRQVPITETWTKPLWDLPGILPGLFLLTLCCFVAEWALRRWKGLP